jgi:branched-chain amino acid transport system substrate-binding protein
VYDSQSDTTKCTELTQKLITDDKVDLVLARHTPETVNPVSAVCERYEIPCIAFDAPIDAWLADGPYEWVYHVHWKLDQMYDQYKALWTDAGFAPGSGAKIGLLFANDADGTAWHGAFADRIKADGYELIDPGQFPADTNNFTDIIKQFKDAGVQILCGTNTNPVFREFWTASKASGFAPDFVTMGKAYLLQADADAIGPELMDGLTGEVWWSPVHPYTSAITGKTPKDLSEGYLADTGRPITQPMGFKYGSIEVAIDALTRAGALDPDSINAAIAATDLDSIVGHVKYNAEHYSTISLTGGQWINDDGKLNLYIVDNSLDTAIPKTGDLKPLAK